MDRWTAPQVMFPSSPRDNEGKGENSWQAFHKLVGKKCGAYLRSVGAGDMRQIMHGDIARSTYKVRIQYEREEVDRFFDQLKEQRKVVL